MKLGPPEPPSFVTFGSTAPRSPVLLAVPHAGRDYPAALLAASRLTRERLETLEDRFADRLIDAAVAQGASAFVALRARAWIDLNRDEREIDPAMLAPGTSGPVLNTAKVRGGLGLVPRRIAGAGEIWRGPFAAQDIAARIARDHRPWHAALAAALDAAVARHGAAVLLDIHSMPPGTGHGIVIGDRHGASAAGHYVERIEAVAARAGLACTRNRPYAGGYTAERHGRPGQGIHVIQIEVDRSLYLDRALRRPASGLPRMAAFIAAVVVELAEEAAISLPALIAAE